MIIHLGVAYIRVGIIAFVAGIYICSKLSKKEKKNEEDKDIDMEGAKKYFKIVNK